MTNDPFLRDVGYLHDVLEDFEFTGVAEVFGPKITDAVLELSNDGRRGRDNDLPAEIREDGTRIWYINGVIGRADGKPHTLGPLVE